MARARSSRCFAVAGSFGLLLVALAPSVPFAAVAMFLFGGMIGGMDVAMNANAVTVEKKLSRAIMSSSHGFWSLGGFVGGGLGGIAIQNYGHLAHAAMVTAVSVLIVAFAIRPLLHDLPTAGRASQVLAAEKPDRLSRSASWRCCA